jgi:peroxiredoxin
MSRTPAQRRRLTQRFSQAVVAAPVVAVLGFLAWAAAFGGAKVADQTARFQVKAGRPVPRMTLRDAAGKTTTLARVLGGAPALVVIMDPKCAHCETEIRSVQTVLTERRGQPVPRVVLVSAGVSEDLPEAVRRYPDLPVYDDHTGAVGRLGLTMVPAHFSVGADGVVRDVRVGVQSPEYLRDVMRAVLAGAPAHIPRS